MGWSSKQGLHYLHVDVLGPSVSTEAVLKWRSLMRIRRNIAREGGRLLTVAPLLLTGNQNTTRCFEFEVLIKIRVVLRGFPWSFYSTWSQMQLWGCYREAFNTSTSKFSDLVCVKILLIHLNSLKTCKTSKTWWSYTYIRKMQDGAGICPPSTQNSSWKRGLLAYAL